MKEMKRMGKDANLHPATVKRIGVDVATGKTRRKSMGKTRRTINVYSIKVDKRVWREAMRLAKGDAKRIEVRSETEVIVR